MRRLDLMGYCDRLAVQPGDTLRFMATSAAAGMAQAQLVRLAHGDEHPAGPGFVESEVEATVNGPVRVEPQRTQIGNFVEVADAHGHLRLGSSFTLYAFIWPTAPAKGPQSIMGRFDAASRKGYELAIDASGRLCVRLGSGTVTEVAVEAPLTAKVWYLVTATFDAPTGRLTVRQEPIVNSYNSLLGPLVPLPAHEANSGQGCGYDDANATFLWGAQHDGPAAKRALYNGKIDRAGVLARVLSEPEIALVRHSGGAVGPDVIAAWDTSLGYTDFGIGDTVLDVGPFNLHGEGHNAPVRGMTGFNWRGKDDCFRLAPQQFGAVYFHDDALTDCRWPPIAELTIPPALTSGVYALRLRKEAAEDHIVFFVRPATPRAKIALLIPTASYLAYANEHLSVLAPGIGLITGRDLVLHDSDIELAFNPELGLSTYDVFSDGAGVCYSSYRRPILNLKPKHRMAATGVPWQFPADLSIVYWLERRGYEYDVVTDEDLHREGVGCLTPYRAVLTGTHSEYYSERMLDATEEYVRCGGRLMYMGANGYYWVVGFRPGEPWCMEVRKLDSGTRAWTAAPGEHYLATTGEKSGLWRNRGRAPQKLTGVGFASEGMDSCSAYRRMPDSYEAAVSWIFAHVTGEVFGGEGLALGGAGGLEIDRYDRSLGTPPGTYLLASTVGFSDAYPHVSEEIGFNHPGTGGTQDYQVRADVTYFTTAHGGAVFSTGSIAWGQALPCNDCDNDVSRITGNVLDAFISDEPLSRN